MPRATWTWTFDLPPGELWPVLADTNRFNEAMGLPPYVLEETPQPNGTVLRRGKGKAAGFTLEWEEKPYEWIEGRHFRQAREFTKGPFRRFGPVFDLEPDGKGGIARQLRPGVRAAHPDGPPVRRPPGQAGRRRGGEAHPRSRRLRQGRAPDLVRHRATRACPRARASAPRRWRPRSIAAPTATGSAPARRPRADRHGDRSRPSQAQEAGASI